MWPVNPSSTSKRGVRTLADMLHQEGDERQFVPVSTVAVTDCGWKHYERLRVNGIAQLANHTTESSTLSLSRTIQPQTRTNALYLMASSGLSWWKKLLMKKSSQAPHSLPPSFSNTPCDAVLEIEEMILSILACSYSSSSWLLTPLVVISIHAKPLFFAVSRKN